MVVVSENVNWFTLNPYHHSLIPCGGAIGAG